MTALRLGVIGPGLFWHKTHRRVLTSMPELFEVTAFCARSEATKQKVLAEDPGRAFFHDYRELLAFDGIDAVLVMTPIPLNATVTIEALRAGKDVFVEKPMARTPAEADAVIAAAGETQRRVFVLEQVAWDAKWPAIRGVLDAGRLGRVMMYERSSHRCMDDGAHARGGYGRTTWRVETDYPLGMLMDGGIHEIMGLRLLFGPPTEVRAWGQNVREQFGDYDVVQMVFDYAGGVRGLFSHSGLLGEGADRFCIRGTEGTLVEAGGTITVLPLDGEGEALETSIPLPHETMWRSLADTCRTGAEPAYSTTDARMDIAALTAVAESIERQASVAID